MLLQKQRLSRLSSISHTGSQQKDQDINARLTGAQFSDFLPADDLITGAVNLNTVLHKVEGY